MLGLLLPTTSNRTGLVKERREHGHERTIWFPITSSMSLVWTELQFPYTEIDIISDWNIMYYYYYDYGDMNWCKHLTQKYFLNEVLNPRMESFLLFSFPSLNVVWQLGIWIHRGKFIRILASADQFYSHLVHKTESLLRARTMSITHCCVIVLGIMPDTGEAPSMSVEPINYNCLPVTYLLPSKDKRRNSGWQFWTETVIFGLKFT